MAEATEAPAPAVSETEAQPETPVEAAPAAQPPEEQAVDEPQQATELGQSEAEAPPPPGSEEPSSKPKWKPTPIDVSDLVGPDVAPPGTDTVVAPVEKSTPLQERSRSRRRERSRSPQRRSLSSTLAELKRERARVGRGHPHCVDCNLQFVTGKSERLHCESQRHQAVMKHEKPFSAQGQTSDFNCYLCWAALPDLDSLRVHYKSEEHIQRLKRYGVEQLLVEERSRHFTHRPHRDSRPSEALTTARREKSPVYVRFKDYYLLDELPAQDPTGAQPAVDEKTQTTQATPDTQPGQPMDTAAPVEPQAAEPGAAEESTAETPKTADPPETKEAPTEAVVA